MKVIWKIIKNVLFAFGIEIPMENGNKNRLSKFVRLIGDIIFVYYFTAMAYACITRISSIFYIHIFDTFLVIALRIVLHLRMKKITQHFEDLIILIENTSLRKNNNIRLLSLLYFILLFSKIIMNEVKKFAFAKYMALFEKAFSFGFIDKNVCDFSYTLKVCVIFALGISDFIFTLFPHFVAVICWLIHIAVHRLIFNFNKKIAKNVLYKGNLYSFQDLAKTLKVITIRVREINEVLSPMLFILIAFWTVNVFYNISKVVLKLSFQNSFVSFLSVLNVVIFMTQLIISAVLASRVQEEISKAKNILFNTSDTYLEKIFDENETANVHLFYSMLDNAKSQMSVTICGIFQLDKSFIFVIIGIIITYQVLIIQILGPISEE